MVWESLGICVEGLRLMVIETKLNCNFSFSCSQSCFFFFSSFWFSSCTATGINVIQTEKISPSLSDLRKLI